MFREKDKSNNKEEQDEVWDEDKILHFLLEKFEDQIKEELFDDFEDYVKFRKDKMNISEKRKILLNNFGEDVEEEMFENFDEYVEFKRAIRDLNNKNFCCPECEEEFELEIDEDDNLEDGVLTDCPECDEEVEVYEENLVENQEDVGRWKCEYCEEEFDLEDEQEEEIEKKGKMEVECPHCHKITTCEYEEN